MKILVVGSGGREHAIIKKIKANSKVEKIFALPGNAGIAKDATCINIVATDITEITKFAVESNIDFAIVSPDNPLVLGCVDALEEKGIPCFGPKKNAAIIEGSKVFSKKLMEKYGIPTASYKSFDNPEEALAYVRTAPLPTVIKADGLALGKGVIIAETLSQAENAIKQIMLEKAFGDSGNKIVVEEFLTGPEVSILAFTDGKTLVPMISSMDHKLSHNGDTGMNTGGMGTIAPNPYYTKEIAKRCEEEIFIPTMRAMNAENRTFKGCLYFGLMLTPNGPKVIEYNCRFGDPETQVVLPLLESDLLEIMMAVRDERLSEAEVKFSDKSACCVVMASSGYPLSYEKGFEISMLAPVYKHVYFSGGTLKDRKIYTNSGRVLGVTAVADSLKEAVENAYNLVNQVHFDNSYYRTDIGAKALKIESEDN